ncbi:hypothetical protein Afil01_00940 [Actinorhabdospora filicis]|uniref:Winged helix DNA-binding domain-containing protein n=1 Tax=Actinorhabdospora filicis TaxID=1785913 RepID=A0A9W6SG71_9ACTN|nr:crosslink repair DNA glycosylase YcaQ family protein [Actinorhabdospora filicis]GLZ75287.1 hypothetical protein Afil01_00940 [Actinorhabdospora filicis]
MDLIAARLTAQALSAPLPTALGAVRRMLAVQAQGAWIPRHILRPRLTPGTPGDTTGTLRTWLMRGTIHLTATEDIGWLTRLFGPYFLDRQAGRRLELGLTPELLARVRPLLAAALPATREELQAIAAANGVPEGQARAYVLTALCQSGDACLDPDGETYREIPAGHEPADPLRELGERYLAGHGPATAADLAAWSGLPLGTARKALAHAAEPDIEPAPVPELLLLGHFDSWLLAYKDRSFTLDAAHAKDVRRGGGIVRPLILVRGRVAGTWSHVTRRGSLLVETEAWDRLPYPALEAEAAALGAFHGLQGEVVT